MAIISGSILTGASCFYSYILFLYLRFLSLCSEPLFLIDYHCGSDQAWSDLFHFTNRRSDRWWVPKIAAFGDMGSVNAQSVPTLEEEVARGTIDVVLHVGDFAYNLDSVSLKCSTFTCHVNVFA